MENEIAGNGKSFCENQEITVAKIGIFTCLIQELLPADSNICRLAIHIQLWKFKEAGCFVLIAVTAIPIHWSSRPMAILSPPP